MGAYSNPQEIEGQQDLAGNARALQGMFNTIVASAQNSSENITKIRLAGAEKVLQENKQRAAKNEALLRDLNEKEQAIQIRFEKGKMEAPKELDYTCYNTALDKWRELQTKIDKGEGSPNDKRQAAQILASVDMFVKGAANTNDIIEKLKVARNNIGDGKIDTKGSDPYMLRAYIALGDRNGDEIQPGFAVTKDPDGNEVIDYSQPGYTIKKWTDKDGTEHSEQFISATKLEQSLNGGSGGGIIFQRSFESNNAKIIEANKATKDGNGIFNYNNGVWNNTVTSAYLEDGVYDESIQIGPSGPGGVKRQMMQKVNQPLIIEQLRTSAESIAIASASNPEEVQSTYFNFVLPVLGDDNPNKDKYKALPEYAQFQKMPADFSYGTTIDISDNNSPIVNTIKHNQVAAVAQVVPEYQPVGNAITISDKDLLWEQQANKNVPKALLADWNKVKEGGKGVIKTITLPDKKVRNILIAKNKEGKPFLQIVGYNTEQ
jgi:hypothetical protein